MDSRHGVHLHRRAFLGGVAGAAASAALTGPQPSAAAERRTGLIDFHHHIVPPAVAPFLRGDTGWSPQNAIEGMDRAGIATGIALAAPVLGPDPKRQPAIARSANDFGATLGRDHPGRFGLFAALPMTDVPATLAEIDYALDQLHADGFGIASSYGDKWLGDDAFQPIWEKLDVRSAVVFVHPQDAPCCTAETLTYEHSRVPGPPITGAYIDWPMNTARTIFSLMSSGTARRFPHIRFIFAHGGGVMPLLIQRLAGFSGSPAAAARPKAYFPNGVDAEFATFYFECAQAFSHPNIDALRTLVPDNKLLFGSDYPSFPLEIAAERFRVLNLPADTRAMIACGNGAALLPRWA